MLMLFKADNDDNERGWMNPMNLIFLFYKMYLLVQTLMTFFFGYKN